MLGGKGVAHRQSREKKQKHLCFCFITFQTVLTPSGKPRNFLVPLLRRALFSTGLFAASPSSPQGHGFPGSERLSLQCRQVPQLV